MVDVASYRRSDISHAKLCAKSFSSAVYLTGIPFDLRYSFVSGTVKVPK